MMKNFSTISLSLMLAFATLGCDVDQTRDGELPDMDVDVSGEPGEMPAYDIEGPEVDVSTDESTVEVPDIDVETEEKQITTPDIEVTVPADETE